MKKELKEKFEKNKKNMGIYGEGVDTAKPPVRKFKKPQPITFSTRSDNESVAFFDVLDHMRCISKAVDDFFIDIDGGVELESTDSYFEAVMFKMANMCPMLLSKRNIHTTMSISSNKLNVRLENNIGFGFDITYKIVDGVANIVGCTGTITLYSNNRTLKEALENDDNWTIVEKSFRK